MPVANDRNIALYKKDQRRHTDTSRGGKAQMISQRTLRQIAHMMVVVSLIGSLAACGGDDDGAPPVPPDIQTTTLQPADVGLSYSTTLSATGTGPLTWTRTGGTFPTGLDLATDGTVSGTPTSAGPFSFQVEVTGPGGKDGPATIQLTVRDKVHAASVNSSGAQGNGDSGFSLPPARISGRPSFSQDGRFVTFESFATNLVENDNNGIRDIFVHDRQNGQTARVSIATGGVESVGGDSQNVRMTPDGRFVVFDSLATNLVAGDTNASSQGGGGRDIFVHDRTNGTTERVSVFGAGDQGICNNLPAGGNQCNSFNGTISADGRYVAFSSFAQNLTGANIFSNVYVRDRQSGTTTRISIGALPGGNTDGNTLSATISADGQFIVFESEASNLVTDNAPGDTDDTNGVSDIFVWSRATGNVTRVSTDATGNLANLASTQPWISSNGQLVAFASLADDLVGVGNDTNGQQDIFVKAWQPTGTGTVQRVSVDVVGLEGNGESANPFLSPDGTFVVFDSFATNLVQGSPTNGNRHVFVANRSGSGVWMKRMSASSGGLDGDGNSQFGVISDDGRFVGFSSFATNLVASDANGRGDVFVAQR